MSQITAGMVKDLREKTGAGMMDCKAALTEAKGDMEAAIDWLRAKGLAKAAKKASRVASEGLIGVAVEGKTGAVVEVNSETDFVARNQQFRTMVSEIARLALKAGGDVEKLKAMPFPGAAKSVGEHVTAMIATIGENMNVRRTASLSVAPGVVASYIHNQATPETGKIGVLVALESTGNEAALSAFGRQVAMHVAAANPLSLTVAELDPAVVERERAVYAEQARASGKPEAIIAKMVEGRLKKFYQESVLLSQTFVIDGENTVETAVRNAEKAVGAPIRITGFVRYQLGEGIEKGDGDFAAEVAKAASGG